MVERWIKETQITTDEAEGVLVNLGTNNFPRNRPGVVMRVLQEARDTLQVFDDLLHNVPWKMWVEVLPRGPAKGEVPNDSITDFNRCLRELLEEFGWQTVSLNCFWRGNRAKEELLGDDLHLKGGKGTKLFTSCVRVEHQVN